MPKNKTHSGASKRVRVTGRGRLTHEQTNRRHNMEKKPSRRTRRLEADAVFAASDTKRIKKLLGR
jgi:large subunit ribosomal protein L35